MTVEYAVYGEKCEKCGSSMFQRKIASKNSKPVIFIEIIQCEVCRFWHNI